MIATLTLTNFGAHADARFELDPTGSVEIRGASMSGKTTLIHAICFVLWGTDATGAPLPVECIRDGADSCTVTITTKTGTVMRRSMTRSRATTRVFVKAGAAEEVCRTEEDWRAKLGLALARKVKADKKMVDIARLALVPGAWMAHASGNARELRDILSALLPPGDLRAEVERLMQEKGLTVKPADVLDPKAAEEARKVATKRAAEAKGAADRSAATLTAAEADTAADTGPTAEEVAAATATLEAITAWEKHDAAVVAWERGNAAREEKVRARDTWRAARKELDAREPKHDAVAATADAAKAKRIGGILDGERKAVAAAQAKLAAAQAALAATEAALASPAVKRAAAALGGAVERVEAPPAPAAPLFAPASRCPTCNQTLPTPAS